jgi:hypothetical protein
MPEHITADDAEDIIYGDHISMQEVSRHRWYTMRLVVFERDGALLGFYYMDPATEMQEGQDLFEGDPVPVFPVVAREVTTTRYEAASVA